MFEPKLMDFLALFRLVDVVEHLLFTINEVFLVWEGYYV